jgi:hypothetical protein
MTTFSVKNDDTTEVLSDLDMDAVSGTATFATSKLALGIAGAFNGYVGASNPLPVTGTITAVTSITNAVTIQDGGNSITVDGTFWQATQPVSLASIPSHEVSIASSQTIAVTNAGTFVVQIDGAGLTSLQLIDDAVYTDGTGTPSKGIAVMGTDGTNPQLLKTDAAGELQIDVLTMPAVTVTGVSTLAEQQTQTAHMATVAGDTTAIQTAVELIDDTVNTAANTSTKLVLIGGMVPGVLPSLSSGESRYISLAGDGSLIVGNYGTFVVQVDGAALTALQLLDDAVYTDGTGTPSKAIGIAGTDGTNPQILKTDASGELQVDVLTLPAVTIASSQTIATTNAGTFVVQVDGAALTALQLIDNSIAAHDSAATSGVTQIGLEARSTAPTAVTDGDAVRAQASLSGKAVNLDGAIPGLTWSYPAPAGGLVTTAGVTAKAAAGAGIRNYVTAVQVINSHATISTEVVIRDGASGTVLHRGYALANGGGYACTFKTPLRGTADTLIEIAEVTQTATAGVLVNLQGYVAAE